MSVTSLPPLVAEPRDIRTQVGASASDAMLQVERDKVRRLMHSLRDARVALKSEREARRKFESMYLDLKARMSADSNLLGLQQPQQHSVPRPVSELALDVPTGSEGRMALQSTTDVAGTVDKLVQTLDSAQAMHTENMVNDVLTRVMQRTRDTVGAARCTLYVANHDAKELWSLVTDLQVDRLPGEQSPTASVRVAESTALRFPMAAGLAGWSASTGQSVRVADAYKDSRFHAEVDQQNAGFTTSSALCVPLFAGSDKNACAVIQVLNKLAADQFDENDEGLLRTIAAHAWPAVRKSSLFVQLDKLLNSTKQLMTVVDMEKMIVAIMQKTGELLDCEHCCLFVVEEATGTLWSLRPRVDSSAQSTKYERVSFKLGEGIVGRVAATAQPLNYPQIDGESGVDVAFDEQLGCNIKQAICQPILGSNGHVLGVILAANKLNTPEGQFHEQDNVLLRSVCQKALPSMEKCRLFIRLRSLLQGTQELNSERNMKTLIGSITVRAKELLNAERCTLFLLDNSGTELWSYVTDGTVIRVPLGQGIAGTVASTGEPFIVKDAYLDPVFDASVDKKTGFRTRAVMCYPITGEAGHVMGVLQMINKNEKVDEAAFFNEEDEELLHALCSHVGVTLTNSKLFDKINVLIKTASSLNSNKDTATLIGDMMGHARDLLECERATVFLVDEQKQQIWSQVADGTNKEIRLPLGKGIAGTVAATGQSLQIDDAYNDERFDPANDRATGFRTRNILCVPMIVAETNKVLGVTQLMNKKGGLGFTADDLEIISAFSAQACIALRNNQLFKESADLREHFESVLRSLKSLVIAVDRRGRLLTTNHPDMMTAILGTTQAEVAEQSYHTWLAPFPELVEDIKRGLDKDNTDAIEDKELRPSNASADDTGTNWPRYSIRPLSAKHGADRSGRSSSLGVSNKPAGVVIALRP